MALRESRGCAQRTARVNVEVTIPAIERVKAPGMLDRFNLNAFSLLGTDESLAESLANREIIFNGTDL
jgi:hypothetical protein